MGECADGTDHHRVCAHRRDDHPHRAGHAHRACAVFPWRHRHLADPRQHGTRLPDDGDHRLLRHSGLPVRHHPAVRADGPACFSVECRQGYIRCGAGTAEACARGAWHGDSRCQCRVCSRHGRVDCLRCRVHQGGRSGNAATRLHDALCHRHGCWFIHPWHADPAILADDHLWRACRGLHRQDVPCGCHSRRADRHWFCGDDFRDGGLLPAQGHEGPVAQSGVGKCRADHEPQRDDAEIPPDHGTRRTDHGRALHGVLHAYGSGRGWCIRCAVDRDCPTAAGLAQALAHLDRNRACLRFDPVPADRGGALFAHAVARRLAKRHWRHGGHAGAWRLRFPAGLCGHHPAARHAARFLVDPADHGADRRTHRDRFRL